MTQDQIVEVSPFLKLYKTWLSTKTNKHVPRNNFPQFGRRFNYKYVKGTNTKATWNFVVKQDLSSSIDLGSLILDRTAKSP